MTDELLIQPAVRPWVACYSVMSKRANTFDCLVWQLDTSVSRLLRHQHMNYKVNSAARINEPNDRGLQGLLRRLHCTIRVTIYGLGARRVVVTSCEQVLNCCEV